MQTLILSLHIIVCVMLVILVLLQAGKEGMGVIFGGGSSSVFGSGGAGGILSKLTAFMAVLFVFTSLSYTYVTSVRPEHESVILDVKLEEALPVSIPSTTPAAPAIPQTSAAPATEAGQAPKAETTAPAAAQDAKPQTAPAAGQKAAPGE